MIDATRVSGCTHSVVCATHGHNLRPATPAEIEIYRAAKTGKARWCSRMVRLSATELVNENGLRAESNQPLWAS